MGGKSPEVVIIGGGVIGTSIAYYLACNKVQVTLLEKAELAAGTSGACDGLIFLQSKKPGLHLKLALRSQELFAELQEQLPVPIHYAPKGGLIVMESEPEIHALQENVETQQASGLDVRLLDRQELLQIEPNLGSQLLGAAYCAQDAQVNPIALVQGLALGARARGAVILPGTEVLDVHCTRQGMQTVSTSQGIFQAKTLVIAAGVWTPFLGKMAGLDVPITPRRGQLLVTEPEPPLLGKCLLSARYLAAKFWPVQQSRQQGGVSMEQTEAGNLLLGSTREFAGFDRSTTLAGLRSIAKASTKIMPGLKNIKVIRSFAGLRPYTPDGLPILGPAPGLPGLVLAAGHEGDGIALAPVTGLLVAQLIQGQNLDFSLQEFGLERFVS